jgi:hypothetical protein
MSTRFKGFITDHAIISEKLKECLVWTAIGVFLTLGVINALILVPDLYDRRSPFSSHRRSEWSSMLDSNGDERADVIKTYVGDQLVRIDSDRNFDGRIDLIQKYADGALLFEIHDDDFDGKPETIKEFSGGKLTIIERDPAERGRIETVEYYDSEGKLLARKTDPAGAALSPMPQLK